MWLGFKVPCLSETGTANFQDLCSPLRVMAADAEQPDVPPAVAPDNPPIAAVCQTLQALEIYLPSPGNLSSKPWKYILQALEIYPPRPGNLSAKPWRFII